MSTFTQEDKRRLNEFYGKIGKYSPTEAEKSEFRALMRKERIFEAVEESRFDILDPADLDRQPGRQYLLKGLLAERDLACIFGPPGVGKSVIAP